MFTIPRQHLLPVHMLTFCAATHGVLREKVCLSWLTQVGPFIFGNQLG